MSCSLTRARSSGMMGVMPWEVRRLTADDWTDLWPLLQGMGGVGDPEETARRRYERWRAHFS